MSGEAGGRITLRLLRGFALSVGSSWVPVSGGAQRLVAFLALQDRPRTRAYIAGTLWPETTEMRANANLRSSLWRAQRSASRVIEASAQEMVIARDIEVDVRQAVTQAHRLLDNTRQCEDVLTSETQRHLSADLLPDWCDSDWVLIEQEQYHQLRLHALEAMAERLVVAERHGEAVTAALAAVRAEPLRESAHRVLVKAHVAAGNYWAAMQQYEQYRHLLLDELGLEPSRAFRELLPQPVRRP
jgi:DNA-binding SARP family transcriptional activator